MTHDASVAAAMAQAATDVRYVVREETRHEAGAHFRPDTAERLFDALAAVMARDGRLCRAKALPVIAAYLTAARAAAVAAEREACLRDLAAADCGSGELWAYDGYTPEEAAREAAATLRADAAARIRARSGT